PVVGQAIALWHQAGVHGAALKVLERLRYQIVALPGAELGEEDGHLIEIAPIADGYGWDVDPARDARVPGNRMDLLTVVAHEMGHVLGLPDEPGAELMGPTLSPGVRHEPVRSELPPALRTKAAIAPRRAVPSRPSPWARAKRVPPSWRFGHGSHRGHGRP